MKPPIDLIKLRELCEKAKADNTWGPFYPMDLDAVLSLLDEVERLREDNRDLIESTKLQKQATGISAMLESTLARIGTPEVLDEGKL